MFQKYQSKAVREFIHENTDKDLNLLLLKKSPFEDITIQELVQQIKGRKVAEKKFPFLLKEGIVFPPNLNLEQASSQATALYKSQFLKGESFLDLTCGFGIDAYFLSQNFRNVTLVEQNPQLIEIVEHNWNILGRNARFINQNLEDFLTNNQQSFDVIYLDPARRDSDNRKKFLLEDLSPNLLDIIDNLMAISGKIVVKLSPLIDISYLSSEIKNIEEIKIIAVKNEVKELVLFINKNHHSDIKINCINLESSEPEFGFELTQEKTAESSYSSALSYLYIPNNAILKAGVFDSIAQHFGIKKLHPNTHFYTTDRLIENFPGRILQIQKINPKVLEKNQQYNIISKNYPMKPEEIKKKYKLRDGGEDYLVFTQSVAGKEVLCGKPINH